MNISKVQPRFNNTFVQKQNNSNVSFKAKLEISDEFIKDIDETFDELKKQNFFSGNKINIEKEIAKTKLGIYQKLKKSAQLIKKDEPKDLVVTIGLTDEYKTFKESGCKDEDFRKKYHAGKYKTHELRFVTEKQVIAGKFNFNILEMDCSILRLYAIFFGGLNRIKNK